jgi:SAM-dependent methyltransferase
MSAPAGVRELVDRFPEKGTASFLALKETAVRREFIDPLFSALGWDVSNTSGESFLYKEVIHEDQIRVSNGRVSAPDYAFRIGGKRKFFVEAKKPSVNLRDDPHPAHQLRRYAWSANLPLSIVSDFQEFCVYDCRIEPEPSDRADTACEFYVEYQDYEQEWDRIYSLFSKEAVLAGSLDRFAEQPTSRKGTKSVDAAFLKDMEMFRLLLADNIAGNNLHLSSRDLNYAVQMTLNRILFLRISEDRGIEPFEQLKLHVNQTNAYGRLCELFRGADERYNSGLFHFLDERGRSTPTDDLTLELHVDDEPLRQVVDHLYYPHPYEFEMIPIEIMGQVYEQFLGRVVELDDNHRVQIVEKPEVKKAGGVFYTPSFVVDYIVHTILDEILAKKSPKEVSALRVLDAACGSGTFLVGAYRCLLEWHRANYLKDTKKNKKVLYKDIYGDWQLTTSERRRILLNSIFGVDIDPQAVENAKLALLMMVLEGATSESLGFQLSFARERALPDLDTNIRCGNSLIDFSYSQLKTATQAELDAINPFDWSKAFPNVMSAGGFDIILGNPPYVRIQIMKEWAPIEVDMYKQGYVVAGKGNYDKYLVFIERALQLLKKDGRLGYIVPHKFFNAQYGESLRKMIGEGKYLDKVIHFGDEQVFRGASTYTCLMFLNKAGSSQVSIEAVEDLLLWKLTKVSTKGTIPAEGIGSQVWNLTGGFEIRELFQRLCSITVKLEDVTDRIFQGIKTSADKIYIVEELEREVNRVKVRSPQTGAEHWLEPDLLHPLIKGGDSKPYSLLPTKRLILFPYAQLDSHGSTVLIPAELLVERYPLTWSYLLENKSYLEEREHGKMIGPKWYGYVYPKALDVMPQPKIFTPDIAARASYSLDETGEMFFTGGASGGYGILVSDAYSREYILGLLNSKLLEWIIRQSATQMRGGYFSFEARFIRELPIHVVDFDDSRRAAQHNDIVTLVRRMLTLNRHLIEEKTAFGKTLVERAVTATYEEIDNLVFDLYELTPAERSLIQKLERSKASIAVQA